MYVVVVVVPGVFPGVEGVTGVGLLLLLLLWMFVGLSNITTSLVVKLPIIIMTSAAQLRTLEMGKVTLKNITLIAGVWYSVHELISSVKGSTVTPGTALGVSMLDGSAYVCVAAAKPTDDSAWEWLRNLGYVECEAGDPGFFIKSPYADALINIKEV